MHLRLGTAPIRDDNRYLGWPHVSWRSRHCTDPGWNGYLGWPHITWRSRHCTDPEWNGYLGWPHITWRSRHCIECMDWTLCGKTSVSRQWSDSEKWSKWCAWCASHTRDGSL